MSWGYIAVAAGTAIAGYASADASKDASKKQAKGADAAIAETSRQYDQSRSDLAPFRNVGGQALNSIASGLGLQGYYPGEKPLSYGEWLSANGYAPPSSAAPSGGKSGANGLLDITGTGDAIDTIKGLFGKKKKKPKATSPAAPNTQALYQDYVKNFTPEERPEEQTAFNDFNRDFTIDDFEKDPGYQFRMDEGTKAIEAGAAARGSLFSGRAGKELARFGQDYASGEYSNAYNRFNNDRTTRFNRLASLAGVGQTATNTTVNAGANASANISDLIVGRANSDAAARIGQANAVNDTVQTLGNLYLQRRYGAPDTKRIPNQPATASYPPGGWS